MPEPSSQGWFFKQTQIEVNKGKEQGHTQCG